MRRTIRKRILRTEYLEPRMLLAADVVINEFSATGIDSLLDEDGEASDWIELHNAGTTVADLTGTYLTDNEDDLTGWQFPSDTEIEPGGYLLVFASGKDRVGRELHTDFRLRAEGEYLAFVDSDGATVLSEFAPAYPQQFSGTSYGLSTVVDTVPLVQQATFATVLAVPRDGGTVPNGWQNVDFDDSGWSADANGTSGLLPVGFDAGGGGVANAGPGGIGTTDGNSELQLWLNPAIGLAHSGDGTTIGPWQDASGSGNDTRAAISAPPTFENGPADTLNGHPVVRFADDYLESVTLNSPDGEFAFAIVLNADSTGAYHNIFDDEDANRPMLWIDPAGRYEYSFSTAGGGAVAGDVSLDRFDIVVGVKRPGQGPQLYLNGPSLTVQGSGDFAVRPSEVFDLFNRDGGQRFRGELAEMVFYDRALDAAEINSIGHYFQEKFELQVGFTEPTTTLPFATDIEAQMHEQASSALVRIPFTASDPASLDRLLLRMNYDDGFVAYVNGQEVARRNVDSPANTPLAHDATASEEHSPFEVVEIDISSALDSLNSGPAANVLAIHGVNLAADDADFYLLPQLIGLDLPDSVSSLPRHFLSPTPGSINAIDPIDQGPIITDVAHTPDVPQADDILVVSARVNEIGNPLASVELHYRVMFDPEVTVPIVDDGNDGDLVAGDGIFTASIPFTAYKPDDLVRYYVTASDVDSAISRWPLLYDSDGQDQAPEYLGTVVANATVTSPLPRLQWFVAPDQVANVDSPSQIGGRATLFYDGELYDNIFARTRGASSLSVAKKSYKFDFADGHYFRYADDQPRAEEINVNTTFQDKSYLREALTYEIFQQADVPASNAFNVRVDRNGFFFSVATFVEQVDDIFLERNGLDPEGALYKMFNGITSTSGTEKNTRLDEDTGDLQALINGLAVSNPNRKTYVFDNIDIPAAINYMTSGIIVQDFDRGAKNFYVYRDTNGSGEWTQIPWDQDLTLGNKFYDDNISGNGSFDFGVRSHPFYGESQHQLFGTNMMIDAIIDIPETREMYLRRLRTLMDDILQTPDTPLAERYLESRLEELSLILVDDAAADLAKWGAIYGIVRDFSTAVDLIRTNYLDQRREHLFETHNIVNLAGGGEIISTLVPEFFGGASYFVPDDDSLGTTWTDIAPPANINSWSIGQTGLGYENSPDLYVPLINTTVRPADTCTRCTSVFVRIPFTIPDQATVDRIATNGLTLRMKYDDGFVAYVNGQEIARRNVTGTPGFDTRATNHDDTAAIVFEEINVSAFADQLVVGDNVLAIHGLNQSPISSDMLILPALVEGVLQSGGEDVAGIPNRQPENPAIRFESGDFDANPASGNQDEEYLRLTNPGDTAIDISGWRLDAGVQHTFKPGTVIPAGGALYVSPDVTAFRGRSAGPTGGQALFVQGGYDGHLSSFGETVELYSSSNVLIDSLVIPPEPSDTQLYLRVSELHYNPAGPDDSEFIELTNISDATMLDLAGVTVSDGPSEPFVIPAGTTLAPGEYLLLVKDLAAFQIVYPDIEASIIAGQFAGSLSNGGERIKLDDASGSTIVDFGYRDGGLWPTRADGAGASLEMVSPVTTPIEQMDKHSSWRGSVAFGGTPGAAGIEPIGIVINEVLTNTDDSPEQSDAIELLNTTSAPLDIGGWFLSDSDEDLLKFAIPLDTVLDAGQYIVFDENDFNPTPATPGPNEFALDGTGGDDVWLTRPDEAGGVLWFVDDVHFGTAIVGESLGRIPNGAGRLLPQNRVTLGCLNSHGRVGPVVITEINYNPGLPAAEALALYPELTESDLEFIEIHNPTASAIDLSGWRIRGDVDDEFEPGTVINAGSTLVVIPFNPTNENNADRVAAFRLHHGIDTTVELVGGYAGNLANGGQLVRLQRIGEVDAADPFNVPYPLADEVLYDDGAPWPTTADGMGDSLQRNAPVIHGNLGENWSAATPTPGTVRFVGNIAGDLDGDRIVDARDVDLMLDAIQSESSVAYYDIDQDGMVDEIDRDALLTILGSLPGDANLDGIVNSADLNRLGVNWQRQGCATWESGDFTGDGRVSSADLNILGVHWQQAAAAEAATHRRVPQAPLSTVTPQPTPLHVDVESSQPSTNRKHTDTSDAEIVAEFPPTLARKPQRSFRRQNMRARRLETTLRQTASLDRIDEVFALFGRDRV